MSFSECQDYTNKVFYVLLGGCLGEFGRVGIFQERRKCCTIFDFENCAVVNSLETLLISAGHPLESVCFLVEHTLERTRRYIDEVQFVGGDDVFIFLKSEVTWIGFDDFIFIDDRHIVSTVDSCGHIRWVCRTQCKPPFKIEGILRGEWNSFSHIWCIGHVVIKLGL